MCRWRSGCRRIIRCARFAGSPIARSAQLSPRFGRLYVNFGRPSIAPEKLLRALLLQALYTIRSERQLMEQLDYNLLFRWFVGAGHGRRGVVADDVHEESRPAARRRHRGGLLRGGADPRRHGAVAVRRAFHRRRHAARGVGESEEFPAPRSRTRRRRRRQSDREFPRAAPHATTRTSRRRIPMRGCTRRRGAARRGSAIWATC